MRNIPVGRDVLERVLATFVVAVLGPATADGIGWIDWANVSNWKVWGVAGLTAAFTFVKTMVATKVGQKSASLDPKVALEPVRE